MKNTHRILAVLIAMALGLTARLGAQDTDTRHLSVNAGLMVFDRRVAADRLAEWAEDQGGYFTWKSDDSISLRVPDEAVEDLRPLLEDVGDGILRFGRSSVDLREEMMRNRSALEAREEILERNIEMLDSSDVEGTLEIEREIRRLMAEIDSSRGYLNKLEHDAAMALVQIDLSFRSQTVPVHRPSRFDWINSIDFYAFLDRPLDLDGRGSLRPAPIPVPDGFARIRSAEHFTALSPEGVRLRIRNEKNYPHQSEEFWLDALKTDLGLRGYLPVEYAANGTDYGDGEAFRNLLWALPVGTEDYLYLTSIRLNDKKIEILEMAGPAEYVNRYLK